MQCDCAKVKQYREYMLMYASMMSDLAYVDEYVERLLAGQSLTEFEDSLRNMIERALG